MLTGRHYVQMKAEAGKMLLQAQECQRCPQSAELERARGRASLGKNQPWEQDWSVGPCYRGPCTVTRTCWAAHTACIRLTHLGRQARAAITGLQVGAGGPHHLPPSRLPTAPAQMIGSQRILCPKSRKLTVSAGTLSCPQP